MEFTGEQFTFDVPSKRVKADTINRYLFASYFTKDKTILDIACGSGFGTFFYAQDAKEVWGIDQSAAAINYAKTNYSRPNIKIFQSDIFNFDYLADFFDLIITFHTLEQLANPGKFLGLIRNLLKNDGIIILSTPNKKVVSPFTVKPIGQFNKYEFYKRDLEIMFKNNGLKVVDWYGQRQVFKSLNNYFVRKFISLLEKILQKKFGFYGRRESPIVLPINFWREPKDFVVILTKENEV